MPRQQNAADASIHLAHASRVEACIPPRVPAPIRAPTDTVNLVSASTRSKGFVRVSLNRQLDHAEGLDMSPQLLCQRCEMARSDGREICPSCGLEFRESAFLGLPKPSVYRRLAKERIAALPVG